jgi:hypothetical protein
MKTLYMSRARVAGAFQYEFDLKPDWQIYWRLSGGAT